MMTLKDKCRAVITLDRAEVAADTARVEMYQAALGGHPIRGYWIAYKLALNALMGARFMLDRVKRG